MTNDAIEPSEQAKQRGIAAVETVAAIVEANTLERETLCRLEQLVRHGYKFIDIKVRKDGGEYLFQSDWLARLFRNAGATPPLTPEVRERCVAIIKEAIAEHSAHGSSCADCLEAHTETALKAFDAVLATLNSVGRG